MIWAGFSVATGSAAFGRLCVETFQIWGMTRKTLSAAFGRLCVETAVYDYLLNNPTQPPSGGCVLKHGHYNIEMIFITSAAFGRLCVETLTSLPLPSMKKLSRLRAAVC